ncbi:YjbE family integral membrane protein [Rhodoblastus acidophilus]|uniref:YjbE family putative metal transport protein n=1 Tax=Rhodoblastus acidophilus TaxID=1074 RepID=UPI002224AD36|nr:YjbE family putative metal transport protein [Rhodoblastus acidophilus]MCW2285172.1 YjbE family integral membrane protein [Rhodoblastus acidophilus]MCW2334128.1 YjbE family integral membrane protein [Rhodoblastus acidophilus]
MDSGLTASWIVVPLQILFLDLVLSGDNAAVIAMACRTLPKRDASKAIVLGAAGAIVLRVLLTALAGVLISVPFLKLVSAFLLIVIAVNLSAAEPGEPLEDRPEEPTGLRGDILAAAIVIVTADAIMSLDNVVALAAVAAGNLWRLLAGLALSIPILIVGSAALALLLEKYPAFVVFGGLLLGWTAGDLAASDAAYADWVARQAPALAYALPIAGAIFVYLQAKWIVAEREKNPPERRARKAPPLPEKKPVKKAIAAAAPLPKPVMKSAPAPDMAGAESVAQDDLVMLIGLVGLFAVFGASIGYFVFFVN